MLLVTVDDSGVGGDGPVDGDGGHGVVGSDIGDGDRGGSGVVKTGH